MIRYRIDARRVVLRHVPERRTNRTINAFRRSPMQHQIHMEKNVVHKLFAYFHSLFGELHPGPALFVKCPKINRRNLSAHLDKLLESPVDRRADVRNVLPEIDSGNSALGDSFWCEFELLRGS